MELTTPTLIAYDLTPLDADGAEPAILALRRWPGVGADRVGILGLSAGDALACLAAADPRLQGKLVPLALFGGYYDTTTLLRDIGRRGLDGGWARDPPWQPNDIPINVMADATAPARSRRTTKRQGAQGRARLRTARPSNGSTRRRSTARTISLRCRRARSRRTTCSKATSRTGWMRTSPRCRRRHAPTAARPRAQFGGEFACASPSSLLHDTSDQFVPFTESRDFDAALTRLGRPHDFVELSIFAHVEVRGGEGDRPTAGRWRAALHHSL